MAQCQALQLFKKVGKGSLSWDLVRFCSSFLSCQNLEVDNVILQGYHCCCQHSLEPSPLHGWCLQSHLFCLSCLGLGRMLGPIPTFQFLTCLYLIAPHLGISTRSILRKFGLQEITLKYKKIHDFSSMLFLIDDS